MIVFLMLQHQTYRLATMKFADICSCVVWTKFIASRNANKASFLLELLLQENIHETKVHLMDTANFVFPHVKL